MTNVVHRFVWLLPAAALALTAACSQDINPADPRNLDRPSDVVFACWGDLRVNGGDPAVDGPIVVSAQPLASCVSRIGGAIPEGQEDLGEPRLAAFALQPAKGTVAVVDVDTSTVLDSDPLTPGKNAIPIGPLPVGIVPDNSGCYAVSANSASCDLTSLDVFSAIGPGQIARTERIEVTNAVGGRILSKPRSIVPAPQTEVVGNECPAGATGTVYITYPGCNLVAAVDLSTGEMLGGVQWAEDGSATVVDGNVSCPAECNGEVGPLPPDGGMSDAGGGADAGVSDAGVDGGMDAGTPPPPPPPLNGAPRPIAIGLSPLYDRLVVGAENHNAIAVVTLDDNGIPDGVNQIALEGDVGITRLAVTERIDMGGQLGTLGGTAGEFQFTYAIASDRSVRVVDIDNRVECDTQADPRYLYENRDVGFMSCMPVGDPRTPPRRVGRTSPGIELPRGLAPLDVTFATVPGPSGQVPRIAPSNLIGVFAFITASSGSVFVVNVDDDNYPDFESNTDPESTWVPLAIAHQMREIVDRDPSSGDVGTDRFELRDQCLLPDRTEFLFPPRLDEGVGQSVNTNIHAAERAGGLPNVRSVECVSDDLEGNPVVNPLTELAFAAPVAERELIYPDLASVLNEDWAITWEGGLSIDGGLLVVDGPAIRSGVLSRVGNTVRIADSSAPFCEMGAEPFDIVTLTGCDPTRADADCGLDETCYTHPDTPASVGAGTCIPSNEVDFVSGACRDFLVSAKTYSILETFVDNLSVGERRHILRTSPLDGCTDDAQCVEMAALDNRLAQATHPIETVDDPDAPTYAWSCEADPTRKPGPDKCVMTCDTTDDCAPGLGCSEGYCVQGVIPPPECIKALQRFRVRASEAFSVVGTRTGYLHNRILDQATGRCIEDPSANPLSVGRIPHRPPPCTGDGLLDIDVNPCSVTLDHVERYTPFGVSGDTCQPADSEVRTRTVDAVRLTNPSFRLQVVDMETQGDAVCHDDFGGTAPIHSAVHAGYQLTLSFTGGYIPMVVPNLDLRYPIRIAPAPDGRLWIMDQGDGSASVLGRIAIINPLDASAGFAALQIF